MTINTVLLFVALLTEWLVDVGLVSLRGVSDDDYIFYFCVGAICQPIYLSSFFRRFIPREPAITHSLVDEFAPLFEFVYMCTLLLLIHYVWLRLWNPKPVAMVWLGFCLFVSLFFYRSTLRSYFR
jgi:hypothetical protein